MNEETKRKMLRAYFAPPPKLSPAVLTIALGVLGIFMFLANTDQMGVCGAFGLVLIVAGVLWFMSLKNKKGALPTDQQVDEWLAEDLRQVVNKSLDKLGLLNEQVVGEPLMINGPILWATNGVPKEDLLWKKGADNLVRFAVHRITVIQLADQLLGAYAADFNFLKNVTLNERTDEYHYKDVVSVSTQEVSTSYTLPNGVSMVSAQAFKLSVASGESISVTINSTKLAQVTGGTILTTGAEKAVQVIRTMLREKKQ